MKTPIAAVVTMLLTASLAVANPPPRFADPARRAKLEQALPAIEAAMAQRFVELKLPALAYGVVIDGELALVRTLGMRDVVAKAPADEHTVFRIASMTKSFTALAIMKLRDAGKLSLDDPVARHVPELASLPAPARDAGPVTIRQLLTHAGGFPQDDPWADRQMGLSDAQFAEFLRRGIPFSNAPGIEFEYSNLGFSILGRVVSRVSGKPYQRYVQQDILQPLGLTETYWDMKSVPPEKRAFGYRLDGDNYAVVELADGGDGEFAALGSLITSSRDIGRWVAFMLSAYPPRDDPEQGPASRRTLREMQSGASGAATLFTSRQMPGAPPIASAFTVGYGLFAGRDCRFQRIVAHGGGFPGFGSHMRWLPDHGVGVFAMANLTYSLTYGQLTTEIVNLLWETGALEPRRPVASPDLERVVSETARLVDAWDDDRARKLAAANLFLDETLESRREAIRKARADLGACRAEPLKAENALRGTFRMACDQGWLDVGLTLAPTTPPSVQYLSVTGGKPLSDTMKQAVADVIAAIAKGGHNLRLASGVDRQALGSTLENMHARYGTCRMKETLDGDGTSRSRLRLTCDRGDLTLTLRLQAQQIASVAFDRPPATACIP